MTTFSETSPAAGLHTIGAVCERLRDEFPDISISKIRYLEDQGLLQPSRTRGGYRLFAEADVERLITILRLQRDEFLPLRVIREELRAPTADRAKRRAAGLRGQEEEIDMSELCERAGISSEFARQLEDFSLLAPRVEGGERLYSESDADIALACAKIARHGIDARHLRAFRTAAGRQSALLEQVVAPALRSRNLERRAAALEDLERPCGGRAGAGAAAADARPARGGRAMSELDLASLIRDVPDFPTEGIMFKDVMPLIADPVAFRETIDRLAAWAGPRAPDVILGAEARGFIFGGALAYALGCGFVTARKPGKLPWETIEARYALEYGTDALEVHVDAIEPGARVIVLDDVLATGGTARAKIELVERLGGVVVGALFVIELSFLNGRERIPGIDVHALIDYS